jgi:hypothetical protein
MFNLHVGLDEPAEYMIKIQGRLEDNLADWFTGEVACRYETGEGSEHVTVLTGIVADQPALHGLLNAIRDLGMTLLSVDCLSGRSEA